MKHSSVIEKCELFFKLAQHETKSAPSAKTKQVNDWRQYLRDIVLRVGAFLSSKNQAENIANQIRTYLKSPEYNPDANYKNALRYLTGIEVCEEKMKANNVPLPEGISENMLNILKNNLKILTEGKDFNQYQHYTIMQLGQPRYIDLDETVATDNKKDLGF